MPYYLVAFDQGSEQLEEDLASFAALLPLESNRVWIVRDARTARELATYLSRFLPTGDKLIVLALVGGFGEAGLLQGTLDRLHDQL